MSRFSADQIRRARQVLAQPDPSQSPSHRELNARIARHILASVEVQRGAKVIAVPRAVFQAGLRGEKLAAIDGGLR